MACINIVFYFSAFCMGSVYGAALSTEYGVPFASYGLPTRSNLLDVELRAPLTSPEDKLLLSPVRNALKPEVVAPPNSQIQLRDGTNQYSVGFQDTEGTEVKEQGRLISTDNGWEYVIAKTGSYKYTSPEGKLIDVEWIADEKGFRIISQND